MPALWPLHRLLPLHRELDPPFQMLSSSRPCSKMEFPCSILTSKGVIWPLSNAAWTSLLWSSVILFLLLLSLCKIMFHCFSHIIYFHPLHFKYHMTEYQFWFSPLSLASSTIDCPMSSWSNAPQVISDFLVVGRVGGKGVQDCSLQASLAWYIMPPCPQIPSVLNIILLLDLMTEDRSTSQLLPFPWCGLRADLQLIWDFQKVKSLTTFSAKLVPIQILILSPS